jgi:hypothetical protein
MKNALTFCDGGQLQRSGKFVVPTHNESLSPATFYVARGVIYSEPSLDDAAPGRSLDFLWGGDFTKLPQKALRLWGSKFPSRPKATQGQPSLPKAFPQGGAEGAEKPIWRSGRVKPQSSWGRRGQAQSSPVKQFAGKKDCLFLAAPELPALRCRLIQINSHWTKSTPKTDRSRPKPTEK